MSKAPTISDLRRMRQDYLNEWLDKLCKDGVKLIKFTSKEKTCGFCKVHCQNDWCPTKEDNE